MAANACPMKATMNTNIGNPIINSTARTTPVVPTTEPVGSVVGVTFVMLDVILATIGAIIGINVLINVVNGTIIAARTSPTINAHTAKTPAVISANGTQLEHF